jgi:PAS domain S-box-containing protein
MPIVSSLPPVNTDSLSSSSRLNELERDLERNDRESNPETAPRDAQRTSKRRNMVLALSAAGLIAAIVAAIIATTLHLSLLDGTLVFTATAIALVALVLMGALYTALRAAQTRGQALATEVVKLHVELSDFEEAQTVAKYGSWRMDLEGNNIEPSTEYLNIFGITRAEFPTDRESWLKRFIEPERREIANLSLARGRFGETFEITRLFDLGSHGQKWLRTKIIPVFGPGGAVESFRGVVHDLTAEKKAQEQLAESEESYRLITNNMRDFVALHTADGRMIYASPSLERMIGIAANVAIGKKPFSLVHPQDVQQMRDVLSEVTSGRSESEVVQFRFKHADGHYIWLESIIAPVRSEHNNITHYQTVTRNVSLRKQAELAMRESEERFRSLIELSSDWYWEQDEQYRFTFVSREAMKMTGQSEAGFLGKTRWEAFPNAFTVEEWASHRAVLEVRKPFVDWVGKIMDDSTGTVWGYFSLNGRPVFDEAGAFKGYRGTGHDVTEREIAQRTLAARTTELATINHRLELEVARRVELEQNFLMAIEMELAQVGLELHDDLGQELTGIALLSKTLERKLKDRGFEETNEAARISDLVNRTIKHTRMISHGLSPYIWGSAGLVSALTQLANDVESLGVVRCTATLESVDIPDEMVARNLYRIAQEAINNALKHSKATHITASLKQTRTGLKLSVTDDGVGGQHLGKLPVDHDAEGKLHSIRHRSSAIGAELTVRRGARSGTVVSVTWSSTQNNPHGPTATAQPKNQNPTHHPL